MSQLQWLLLLHQIPPAPPYFRAKVLRRLSQLGALPIKNSAYVLPENADTLEDFEWTRSEIKHEGGEAWLFRVEAFGNPSDEMLLASFRSARTEQYKQLLDSLVDLRDLTEGDPESRESALRKLERRLDEIRKIDFFEAP